MLKEVKVLPRFIIGRHNNNVRYAADRQRKKTARFPRQSNKGKLKERIKYQ